MSAPAPVAQPRLGAVGWLRWTWRQLTSMRTALQLLLLLAVAAIPGSVFPQRRVDPNAVRSYLLDHRAAGPWMDRLGVFDVYASPWFSAIYLLLFISLIGCVIPRARVHWRALRALPPRTPSRLERMPEHRTATFEGADQDTVLTAARTVLRRHRYRVAPHGPGEGQPDSWSAEKGYLSESGNLVFHLSLVGLLAAVAFGAFSSYSGQRVLIEGQTFANTLPAYDSFSAGVRVGEDDLPPFSFSLDSLDVKFEATPGDQFGAPRDFDAEVTVRNQPDAVAEKQRLAVNHPLDLDGARVFLVGNGYAPVITVRDAAGDVVYSEAVPFRAIDANYTSDGVVKVADGLPEQLGLVGQLLPTVGEQGGRPVSIYPDAVEPRLLLGAWTGDLYPGGEAQSVYVLNTDTMTQLTQDGDAFRAILAPGDSTQLPDGRGTVTFEGLKRYAALDVRADPTKKWVLGFSVLGLTGLVGSLFVRRRRVWVRVRPGAGGLVVEVAGLPRREDPRLGEEIEEILAELVPPAPPDQDARTLEPASTAPAEPDEER